MVAYFPSHETKVFPFGVAWYATPPLVIIPPLVVLLQNQQGRGDRIENDYCYQKLILERRQVQRWNIIKEKKA